jgi:hypothetical protein
MALFDSIRFTPGRPLLKELGSERLNAIITEIRRNKPKGERGITVRQDGTGTYIGLAAARGRGGTSTPATVLPWDLLARPDPESTSETPPYLVTVQPGMLSGFLAVNWDDEFTLAGTGLHYAKAVVSTDGSAITQVTIQIDTTPPDEQTPELWAVPGTVEYLFGLFVEGKVFRTIGPSHITISPKVWITTEKTALPAPGELPYDYYYVLG